MPLLIVHYRIAKNQNELSSSGCKAVIYVEFVPLAEEKGLKVRLSVSDPGISGPADTEYIASYLLPQ